jgi:signal transduction histidine kinase
LDRFSWLVKGLPQGPRRQSNGEFAEFARSEGFPFAGVDVLFESAVVDGAKEIRYVVAEGPDGEPYRVAVLNVIPALDMPDGPPQGRPEARGRGGPGPGAGRGPGDDRMDRRGGRGGRPPNGPRFGFGEEFLVFMAAPIHEERTILASLLRTLLLAGVLALGASALLIPWTVRRGLGPLRKISDEISLMDEKRLDQALAIEEVPSELAPIVESFEGARERLGAAFVREKRFTSDAAHELRTPLAGLRASMEVALRRERAPEQYRSTMAECLDITCSMQGMVDSLLTLAKGAGHELETAPMDLVDALELAFASRSGDLARRQLTVEVTIEGNDVKDRLVPCHEVLAERIFGNVVANVIQYAAQGSVVSCVFESSADHLCLRVGNEAEDLAADVAERALEPLWRGDAARTDASLHAGLGLAIVQQCVEALGGSVTINAGERRFELSLELPR